MSGAGQGKPRVPASPSQREEQQAPELSSFRGGAPRPEHQTDDLIAKMAEGLPFLPAVLAAPTLEEQLAIVERNLPVHRYGGLIMQLSVIEYFYHAKDKKPADALRLAQLEHALAEKRPENETDPDDSRPSRTRQIADSLSAMAGRHADLGMNAQALEYYQQAEESYLRDQQERAARKLPVLSEFDRVFGGRPALADLYSKMAQLLGELGDEPQRIICLRKLAAVERGNLSIEIRFDRAISSGLAAEDAGDYDAALAAYHEALDLALKNPASTIVTRAPVTACHHLGELLARLGLYRKALFYHKTALDINTRSADLGRLRNDHLALGRICRRRPGFGDARAEFEAALECVSSPASPGDPFSWEGAAGLWRAIDPDGAWEPALEIAREYRAAGEFSRAAHFLLLAIELSEAARTSVLEERRRIVVQGKRSAIFDAMVSLEAAWAGRNEDGGAAHARRALEFSERVRGRAFLDAVGYSELSAPAGIDSGLLTEESGLLEALRALREGQRPLEQTSETGSRASVWNQYQQTRDQLEAVWRKMEAQEEAAGYVAIRRGRPADWEQLVALLKDGDAAPDRATVLVEYHDTGDEYLMFVARAGDSHPEVIPLTANRGDMQKALLSQLRYGAGAGSIDVPDVQDVMAPLLEPLRKHTAAEELIWFVPHGLLHFLPLHALELEGRPLLERNPVCYSPSASVMKYCRSSRTKGNDSLIVADSRPDMPLLFARLQAAAIRSSLGGRTELLSGPGASKSRVEAWLAGATQPAVVHLACHGVFNAEDPLSSGVLLAPEGGADAAILTARDLLRWRAPARLVTLSACQSGLSERLAGDELIGLTRAWLYAGAASVSVSLWAVDEISTGIFMGFFYREWRNSDKAEAMRRAATRLKAMTVTEAMQYCEDAKGLCETAESVSRLEQDIASFKFQARDFMAALEHYRLIRARMAGTDPDFVSVTVALSRCRLALKTGAQPDYTVCPFAHPYYWAPFVLVGSWS